MQILPDLEHASRQGDAAPGLRRKARVTRLEDGELVIEAREGVLPKRIAIP